MKKNERFVERHHPAANQNYVHDTENSDAGMYTADVLAAKLNALNDTLEALRDVCGEIMDEARNSRDGSIEIDEDTFWRMKALVESGPT